MQNPERASIHGFACPPIASPSTTMPTVPGTTPTAVARANGATAESGMAMLVWQAVVSHEHWDGSVYDKGDIAQLCIDSAKELKKNF